MLHLNKLFLFFIVCYFTSCNEKTENSSTFDFKSKEELFEKKILKSLELKEYQKIQLAIIDSVNNWESNQLKGFIDTSSIEFKFDDILCINSELDKIIKIRLGRQLKTKGKLDALTYYYGVKIHYKWYFFSGPTMFIPRSDLSKPTSFEKLHKIAMKEVFSGYLKKNWKGEYEINDKFFSDLTSTAWWLDGVEPKNQEEWDKIYLRIVNNNWKNKDTTKIKNQK